MKIADENGSFNLCLEYLEQNFRSIDNPEDMSNFIRGVLLAYKEGEGGTFEQAINNLKFAVVNILGSPEDAELCKKWDAVIDEVKKEQH
jgi:hypothetical protein